MWARLARSAAASDRASREMALRYDQIADLIKIIDASACDELVLETPELKLVLRRHGAGAPTTATSPRSAPFPPSAEIGRVEPAMQLPPPPPPREQSASANRVEVRAPMVGTFYRASAPDTPPFVEVGTVVAPGQPLCVIEVMKLFTTIFAEAGGRITEIGANNAELVEYGRVLFVIEDAS